MGHGDEGAAVAVLVRRAEEAAHEDAFAGVALDAHFDAGRERELGGDRGLDAVGDPFVEIADEVVDARARDAARVLTGLGEEAGFLVELGIVEGVVVLGVRVASVEDRE